MIDLFTIIFLAVIIVVQHHIFKKYCFQESVRHLELKKMVSDLVAEIDGVKNEINEVKSNFEITAYDLVNERLPSKGYFCPCCFLDGNLRE